MRAQLLQPIEPAESVDGRFALALRNDLARNRMHLVRMPGDEVAYGRGALRHPGALIEQSCRLEEGREIDLDQRRAEVARQFLGSREAGLGIRVTEEELVLAAGNAEAQARG